MKELSIEQKAQRYDEALKVLHKYDGANIMFSQSLKEEMFPELAESEDERIRKEIIDFATKANNGVTSILANNYDFNKWLTWLEKQGKQKPIDKIQLGKKYKCIASPRYSAFMTGKIYKPEDKFLCDLMNFCYDCFEPIEDGEQKSVFEMKTPEESLGIDSDTYNKIVDECVYGEQKPAELPKGEDYGIDGLWHAISILQRTLGEVEGYQSDDGILEHKCAISAVKELYERRPVWSEEDETGWINTKIMIKEAASNHYTKDSIKLVVDWLESIKDRVQPKQEWSEEDIEMLNSAISFVEHSAFTTIGKGKNNVISWLKSLKGRVQSKHSWSEEDENIIKDIIEDLEYAERKGYVLKNNTFLKEIHWLKSLKSRLQ